MKDQEKLLLMQEVFWKENIKQMKEKMFKYIGLSYDFRDSPSFLKVFQK